MNLIYLCIFVLSLTFSDAARILAAFPTPSISHQVVFRPLTQELVKRGHQVVVLTTDPAFPEGQAPANLTEIDVHDLSYKIWREHFFKTTSSGKEDDLYTQIETALGLLTVIFEEQMKTPEMQEQMKDKNKFDLLLTEACVRPALGLSHLFKVPVIQVSSLGAVFDNYEVIGAPVHPVLYPQYSRQKINNLTMWDKFTEIYNNFNLKRLYASHQSIEDEMLKRVFGADTPAIKYLNNNVHMLFLNINPIWEGNFPVPPSVVYMGGIHVKPKKEIPSDLKAYLDSSKNGVIYMSFGTNVSPSLLPKEKIHIILKVFSQLPYDVLWKWDKDELPGKSKNIRISKWLPQSDLLRHPKVKVFITQGGLQSTDEAIAAGVPLIGMPMLGDQWYNVEKYVQHKFGLRLDLDILTEEKLKNAINTVIGDDSYQRNVVRLRELMKDQPQTPLQRAVWWTEYVMRHKGARHLRAPAANISWSEYLELELISTVLFVLITPIILIITIVTFTCKKMSRKTKIKNN